MVSTRTHEIVGRVKQVSPFCPNIAASPDGDQVWLTLKDVGKVMVFAAKPPFEVLRVLDTGPITNHVNFVRTPRGQFAYVTVGGLNQVKVFRTADFEQVATIPVGDLPHGIWPSGDGTRVYVGIENGDAVTAIDTSTNRVIATIPNGQAAQALVYVPAAAPTEAAGTENLQPLGIAGAARRTWTWRRPAAPRRRPCPCSTKGSRKCCRRRSSVSSRPSPTCSRSRRTRTGPGRSSRLLNS